MLVATKETYSVATISVTTNICRDKHNVTKSDKHKHVFVATKHVFNRDKSVLVATKIILVAAPPNDTLTCGQQAVNNATGYDKEKDTYRNTQTPS